MKNKQSLYWDKSDLKEWLANNKDLRHTTLYALTKLKIAWVEFKIALGESILRIE